MSGIITNNQKVLIELHVGSEGNFVCDIRFSPPLPKPHPLTVAQKVAAVLASRIKASISPASFARDGAKQREEDDRDGDLAGRREDAGIVNGSRDGCIGEDSSPIGLQEGVSEALRQDSTPHGS